MDSDFSGSSCVPMMSASLDDAKEIPNPGIEEALLALGVERRDKLLRCNLHGRRNLLITPSFLAESAAAHHMMRGTSCKVGPQTELEGSCFKPHNNIQW